MELIISLQILNNAKSKLNLREEVIINRLSSGHTCLTHKCLIEKGTYAALSAEISRHTHVRMSKHCSTTHRSCTGTPNVH